MVCIQTVIWKRTLHSFIECFDYSGLRKMIIKHLIIRKWNPISKPINLITKLTTSSIHYQEEDGNAAKKKSKVLFDDEDPKTKDTKSMLNDTSDADLYFEYHQKEYGHVYDKKPVKVKCYEGKIYMWCACGFSKMQVING